MYGPGAAYGPEDGCAAGPAGGDGGCGVGWDGPDEGVGSTGTVLLSGQGDEQTIGRASYAVR
ncbi:hypothetical protein GCM10017667_13760 [Streptomyces filamentosus]|uniref:Uncharacterized protein n=1 Tax=Streptomyces filamentosus TaxID=67294 RepID=A0A919BG29_STRFL|nr:hypothetical protein GCM10017667_13760 [Streptomyces filamentosus]